MKFSVVTPSYNQLHWLKLCAASVADQRSDSIEVEHIVQDGGSGEALLAWGQAQSGLRFFSAADAGMYDAINNGLLKSTGDICSYLNCDEQYLPGALATVGKFFQENEGIDIVGADIIVVDDAGNAKSYRRAVLPMRLDRWHVPSVATAALFFRRRIVDEGLLLPGDYRIVGDAVWIDRLLSLNKSFAVLPIPLAVFGITGANLSRDPRVTAELSRWRGLTNGRQNILVLEAAAKLFFRLRKLFAGAYQPRTIDYEIYTFGESGDGSVLPNRSKFKAESLSGRWS